MARGKGKNCPKLKIFAFLKLAYQKFSENALSKLKIPFCEIYYIKQDTLMKMPTKVIKSYYEKKKFDFFLPFFWIILAI